METTHKNDIRDSCFERFNFDDVIPSKTYNTYACLGPSTVLPYLPIKGLLHHKDWDISWWFKIGPALTQSKVVADKNFRLLLSSYFSYAYEHFYRQSISPHLGRSFGGPGLPPRALNETRLISLYP